MANVITFGIQKGGTSKTTTTGITAYLMAEEGCKVLVVDMDSQGNATDLITQVDPEEIEGQTVLEAIADEDAAPYIIKGASGIDVLPADDYLAALPELLYDNYKRSEKASILKRLLEPLTVEYDYILIDTPPSLSEAMTNAICASDYIVILAEASKWAFTAVPRFLETVEFAKENVSPNLEVAGILRTMSDSRRSDTKGFNNLIAKHYSDLVFDTIIKRKAKVGRLSIEGFEDNKELKAAIAIYKKFYIELKKRTGG